MTTEYGRLTREEIKGMEMAVREQKLQELMDREKTLNILIEEKTTPPNNDIFKGGLRPPESIRRAGLENLIKEREEVIKDRKLLNEEINKH